MFYVINLDRSADRMEFMRAQLHRFGIEAERFPGVDGAAGVPDWLSEEFAGPHELTNGEIGCYASHLKIAQMMVGESLPHVVVLEDDVTIDADFERTCREAIANAPASWDYIHLSSVVKRAVMEVGSLSGGRSLIRYSKLPVNTAAYILSNRGARKWLTPMPRCRPNDVDIRYAFLSDLNVLGVYPAPAFQGNDFPSVIGGTHTPHMRDPRSWSPGPFSELFLERWNARRLGLWNYTLARVANVANSARRRVDGRRRVAVLRGRPQSTPVAFPALRSRRAP